MGNDVEKPWYHGVKWTVEHYGKDELPTAIHFGHNNRVCFMPTPGSENGELDKSRIASHARLIAKAPETATERDTLKARVAELEAERDEAQSAVTAWQGACASLEAHLQDRVAMGDASKPQLYLEILRADINDIQRKSTQIVAARWADYKRQRVENDALRDLCGDMARVLKNTNDLYEQLQGHATAYSHEARAALSRAKAMGVET